MNNILSNKEDLREMLFALQDKIAAKFDNGELLITLPKTKEIKPEGRQIKIS